MGRPCHPNRDCQPPYQRPPLHRRVAAKEAGHITLDRALPFPIRAGWRASVHSLVAPLQHSGVERLTVEFK